MSTKRHGKEENPGLFPTTVRDLPGTEHNSSTTSHFTQTSPGDIRSQDLSRGSHGQDPFNERSEGDPGILSPRELEATSQVFIVCQDICRNCISPCHSIGNNEKY